MPDFSLSSLLPALIARKLSPALFEIAGGDTERAEAEMLEAIADYRPRNRRDVIAAGQIIIYGLAGITTAGASIAADVPPAHARDLCRIAIGFNRAAEQNRPVLRLSIETSPAAFSDADQQREDEALLSAEAAAVLAAEAEARLRTPATDARARMRSPAAEAATRLLDAEIRPEAYTPTAATNAETAAWSAASATMTEASAVETDRQVRVAATEAEPGALFLAAEPGAPALGPSTDKPTPVARPDTSPILSPTPRAAEAPPKAATAAIQLQLDDPDQRREAMWAIAMMKEADYLCASMAGLPPVERREASIKVSALSSAAQSLLTGDDPMPLPAAFRFDKRNRPVGG